MQCDFFSFRHAQIFGRVHTINSVGLQPRPTPIIYVCLYMYGVCVLFYYLYPVENLHRTKPPNGHWKQFVVYFFIAHANTYTQDECVSDVILKLLCEYNALARLFSDILIYIYNIHICIYLYRGSSQGIIYGLVPGSAEF